MRILKISVLTDVNRVLASSEEAALNMDLLQEQLD